ncbi:hypothetical protein KQX54_006143 [Cotesia glomerata]|uniref:Uncharacterized protein n=1 Tax=Cotesia glomerata TaxID=32391 RepID=A0AAV7I780_COTGL|nr:hypothetical protein KQX54_006143 [Cotesia glomerata]
MAHPSRYRPRFSVRKLSYSPARLYTSLRPSKGAVFLFSYIMYFTSSKLLRYTPEYSNHLNVLTYDPNDNGYHHREKKPRNKIPVDIFTNRPFTTPRKEGSKSKKKKILVVLQPQNLYLSEG